MKDRLVKLMEYKGLTSAQFADVIGVQRSSISHILSGRNKPSYDFLVKILERFDDINAQWLITGLGTIENKSKSAPDGSKEHDLFTQPQKTTQKPINEPTINPNTIISNSLEAKNIQEEKPFESDKLKEVTNVNNVKTIIFIYENNTFEVINKK